MEPASAAAFACARKVERRGGEDEQTWVMIGTGAFAKWQESLGALFEPVSTLAADFDRVEELGLLE
jgi:threonine synthase